MAPKRDQPGNLTGFVVGLFRRPGEYGVVCTDIESVDLKKLNDGSGWYRIQYRNSAGAKKETVIEADSGDQAINKARSAGVRAEDVTKVATKD